MNPTYFTTNSFVNMEKFVKILNKSLKIMPCTDLEITYSVLV